MKIILTQEVTGLGEPGDIVEVRDGYGRNFLLPRGLATPWTKGGQKQVDSIRAARKAREVASLEDAKAMKARLEAQVVRVKVKAGDDGRLFGSVTPTIVGDAIAAADMGKVDTRKIEIGNLIKTTGQYTVGVRLHPEVAAKLRIDVTKG